MNREIIRLSKSCISKLEKRAVASVLDKEYLGMGEEVRNFEKILTKYFNRETLCVSNGTAALQLAIEACDIGIGDEILVPSLTYVSSFQAIRATGAKPIACDIEENTFLMDLNFAQKKVNNKTKAIMPVHFTGGVGDYFAIYDFAKKNNLRVIEDAAHAFGTVYDDKLIGSIGDIVCFSFDGIKNITSGEGGCIVTHDKKIISRVKDARLLGVKKDTEKRYSNNRSWSFDVTHQGWRYHMSNIMASIGIVQFNRFEKFKKIRRLYAKLYESILREHPLIILLDRDYNNIVPHIFVIRIKGLKHRDLLQEKLKEKGIETGVHYQPNHILTFFINSKNNLPITEKVASEILTLPLHPDLSRQDVKYVSKQLISLLEAINE